MDPDLQRRIDEAKAAGFSDGEIAKILGMAPPTSQATTPNGSTVPILSAEEKAQFNEAEQKSQDTNTTEKLTTLAGIAGPVIAGGAGTVLAWEGGKWVTKKVADAVADKLAQQAMSAGAVPPTFEQGSPIQEAKGPVQPSGTARQVNIVDANAPQRTPVAPQAAPQAATQAGRQFSPQAQEFLAQQAARGTAPAAGVAAESGGMLSRMSPYLQAVGKVAAPIARIAGSAPVMGAQMGLYSGDLNQGEAQQMARARVLQDTISKMPMEQQSFYFTLPQNKKQQIDQMIMNGQDPSALLVPNAINSGFEQKLNTMGRR
jgi:hypothetical protein